MIRAAICFILYCTIVVANHNDDDDDNPSHIRTVKKSLHGAGWRLREPSYDPYRNNPDIVKEAVSHHGHSLQYAHEDLKSHKGIVLAAVRNDGFALRHVKDTALLSDVDIITAAVLQRSSSFKFADVSLKANRTFVLSLVRKKGDVIQYAAEELKGDVEIATEAVVTSPVAYRYVAQSLHKNRSFVLDVLRRNPKVFLFLEGEYQHDEEVIALD
eukprot:PhF_6_TR477/c0_g1_i1/m.218